MIRRMAPDPAVPRKFQETLHNHHQIKLPPTTRLFTENASPKNSNKGHIINGLCHVRDHDHGLGHVPKASLISKEYNSENDIKAA